MLFISLSKLFLFLRCLNFPLKVFGHVGKPLVKKAEFQNRVVINWETHNYNTHIAQYLKKLRIH